MKRLFLDKPWLWIVYAFVFLILLWVVFVVIAVKNEPKRIPLKSEYEGK